MFRRFARPLRFRTLLAGAVCGAALLALLAFASACLAQDVSPSSVPVFVGDFEIAASPITTPPTANSPDATKKPLAKDAPPAVFELSDIPGVQARRLMDFFAVTLVQEFQKAGYTAARQQSNSRPDSGVLLRGVFGEADARNRIRRAMLGGGAPGERLLLYVGTFNLSRPDQPLYQLAAMQNSDGHSGPIITLNNYIPLVKFELSKNPTEAEVQRISKQIVQNLSTLLKSNPAAFSQ